MTMKLDEAIRQRKSVRAFKSEPVPKEVLSEILSAAQRAPSWANTQPWEFVVATGDKLAEINRAFIEKTTAGEGKDQQDCRLHVAASSRRWPALCRHGS